MSQAKYRTNMASEFHVLSLLYRLGLDAELTLGNRKAVDIIIVRGPGDVVTIDVKAVAGKNDWFVNAPEPPRAGHFVILVSYEGEFGDLTALPRIWIYPHADLLPLIRSSATGSAHYVSRKDVTTTGAAHEGAWEHIQAQASL